MATIRLTPGSYAVSNTTYVTTSNPNNALTNTDSTSYGQFTHNRNQNTSYYVYFRGFDFSSLPSDAVVSSFSIKLRGLHSGLSTSTAYYMRLYNGTTAISNTTVSSALSTSAQTITFPTGSLTWSNIVNYGNNFTVGIPMRRASTSTSGYVRVYGVEIEVTYTVPIPINVSSIIISGNGTISPSGTVTKYEGDSYTLTITPDDTSEEVTLVRNGTDVTAQLIPHYNGGGTISQVPGSNVTTGHYRSGGAFYQSSSTSSDAWLRYAIGHSAENPYSTSNTSNTYSKDGTNDSNTQSWMIYPFDFSSIPANATIDSVEVKVYGAAESTSQTARHADASVWSGNTQKGSTQQFSSTNNGIMTLNNVGTWTRAELQNAYLRFGVGYYGGRILGATWTVEYTVPSAHPDYYTYEFVVGSTAQVLEVTIGEEPEPYIPEPEDPNKEYYSLTISSINADTDPENGTTRIEEGTDVTIEITPTDPLLTLALDNGVDITNQLVAHNIPSNTYTVSGQVSGASYGFVLNSSTGYYTSNNQAHSNSAAVARLNLSLDVACLVTIEYINYAEATYDYGIFGRVDTALSTSYTADSNAYLACSSNSYNTSIPQTLTYTVSAGNHYIDIKYRKDTATDSNNDDLRWKIVSITPIDTAGYYTYTINNIDQKHSLIFIFGNVNFYFINSSTTAGARIFPDGQSVVLEGDRYKLDIVPDAVNATVAITDNGNTVTSALTRIDGYDKNNNPVVSYTYTLTNITAAHNLVVSIGGAQIKLYVKQSGAWVQYSKAYRKINGAWVEQDITGVFSASNNYKKGN